MANNDINFSVSMVSHVEELNTQLSGAVKKALEEIGIEAEAFSRSKKSLAKQGIFPALDCRYKIDFRLPRVVLRYFAQAKSNCL